MSNILNHELPFEKYFEEICQYPHDSYQEKILSDYLTEFARELHLKYKQDELGNVVIYKDGTPGQEDHQPLIIQAHIDMICLNSPGHEHDFTKDPLDLYVEDGLIRARGTTLGADDGVGVAYMMAILASDSVKHPPLECLFTVQEEVGCAGAAHLKSEDFKGVRLLSLDEMSGNATTVSGAGMNRLIVRYSAEKESTHKAFYELTVSGLIGGHSGDDINKERANANKLVARFMFDLYENDRSLQFASISGGTVDNAISRTCTLVFASDKGEGDINSDIEELLNGMREEYKYSDTGLAVEVKICEEQDVFSIIDTENIVKFLYVCPDGFRHRSMHLELTTASSNMGVVKTEENGLMVSIYIRGASKSFVDTISNEIITIADVMDWKSEMSLSLPCWEYRDNSPMRDQLKLTYEKVTGTALKEHAEHGCLEAGHFTAMKKEMDIVTLGPLVKDYHTYEESLDRASFAQIYEIVLALLEQL